MLKGHEADNCYWESGRATPSRVGFGLSWIDEQGRERGWVGTPLVRNLVFFRTGKKKHHVLSFLEIFFRCHLCGCSKKKGGILYSLMYLWYILIFQYLIFSFTQTLRYWSAPFTPILSPLHPSDTEDRVQVGEKEKGILILYVQDIFRTHVIIHS